jgi:hypothetical protein
MVIAVASLAAFLQVLGEVCTQASNSLVTGRGEGWGYSRLSGYRKSDTDRQGFPRALPFPFVHLRKAGKGDYLQGLSLSLSLRSRLKAKLPWIPRKILRLSHRLPSRKLRASRS